jgi:hypothetical protein
LLSMMMLSFMRVPYYSWNLLSTPYKRNMLLLRSTYVVCNFLIKNLIATIMLWLKMILVTTLKEESMLMNSIINLMILYVFQKMSSYMIQLVTLLNVLLVIVTTMKEEVISTLFMFQVMIWCAHPLIIYNGIPLVIVI